MANTFTNFDAARTSAIVFEGFVSSSVGRQTANLVWGQRGSTGVHVPTISGVAIDDVSNILGYANKQSISNSAVLVSFNKYKGFNFVIDLDQQSTTVVDLGAEYSRHEGRLLAEQIDTDLYTEMEANVTSTTAAAGATIAATDILAVWRKLNALKVPMSNRVWVFDPVTHAEVMSIDAFVGANQTGNAQSDLTTGVKGTLLGAPVFMSPVITASKGYCVYKPALALAFNRDIEVQVGRVPGNFGVTYEGSVKYGVKVIDAGGISEITT